MAKNKRKSSIPVPQQAARPPQKPNAKLSSLLAVVNNAAEALQVPTPKWTERLFEDLQAAIKEERRDEFQQVLANFMQAWQEASAAVERSAQHAREYDAKLAALDDQRAALGVRDEELDRVVAALAQRQNACTASEGALLKQGGDLADREENAAGGFLKERVEATKQRHIELDALAAQRLYLQAELARVSERLQIKRRPRRASNQPSVLSGDRKGPASKLRR